MLWVLWRWSEGRSRCEWPRLDLPSLIDPPDSSTRHEQRVTIYPGRHIRRQPATLGGSAKAYWNDIRAHEVRPAAWHRFPTWYSFPRWRTLRILYITLFFLSVLFLVLAWRPGFFLAERGFSLDVLPLLLCMGETPSPLSLYFVLVSYCTNMYCNVGGKKGCKN